MLISFVIMYCRYCYHYYVCNSWVNISVFNDLFVQLQLGSCCFSLSYVEIFEQIKMNE